MESKPRRTKLQWQQQVRIIATRHPKVDLFERTDLTERQKRAVFAAQASINPRIRQQIGDLSIVAPGDMMHGYNASIVMAPFTHHGVQSRFSDGSYGVYYAAKELDTAIFETIYHRERHAIASGLKPEVFQHKAYVGKIKQPLYDLRGSKFQHLHHPQDYTPSQAFGKALRMEDPKAYGVVYNSVRHEGGECIGAFRPTALTLPKDGHDLTYEWDGSRIVKFDILAKTQRI